MEINAHDFIEIFRENFEYPIVDTLLGKCVEMTSYDAFVYSSVTGAGYFDNSFYPYTPKGLLKVFYNAFDYNFVTGMFDHSTLKNTPFYMWQSKPYLFEGNKFILPIEFKKETELQELLSDMEKLLISNNINSTDFIIQRIEKRKKGNGMEPLMEYLAAEVFKARGFIVETQVPLTYNTGSPDFGGFCIGSFNNFPNEVKYFEGGFHLIELSLIRLFNKHLSNNNVFEEKVNKTVVGEAKTSTAQMTDQLNKYLNTSLFDEGYELHPSKVKSAINEFGLLSLDSNYRLRLDTPKCNFTQIENELQLSRDEYFLWLENYVKYYLIANVTNDELSSMFEFQHGRPISSSEDIVSFINNYSIEHLFLHILNLK